MTGFVSEADYNSIVTDMKMTDGTIFGLPIVLDTDCEDVAVGDTVLLTYKG
jgi:sulfate adenylyltransferase